MVTNKELEVAVKELSDRVYALEENQGAVADPRFDDLLAGIMEALVRARSQGAHATAVALRDKYLDPGTSLADYGEAYVVTGTLRSAGLEE